MKKFFLLLLLLNSLLIGACSTVATDGEEITEQSLLQDRRTREAILIDKDIETEASAALMAAISRLRDDAALRQRLGTAARSRVKALFSLDTCVQRYLKLYTKVMAGDVLVQEMFDDPPELLANHPH